MSWPNNSTQVDEVYYGSNNTLASTVYNPVSPEAKSALIAFLYSVIVIGILSNVVVLTVFISRKPSSTTDWFILFITVYDFLSSLFNVPIYVTMFNGLWSQFGSNYLCKVHMCFSQCVVLSASFFISGLAFDRYLKICRPASRTMTIRRARNVCIIMTIGATVLSLPSWFMFRNEKGRCVAIESGGLFLYYLMVFLIFCITTVTVLFSYVKVTKAIFASERRFQTNLSLPSTSNNDERSNYSRGCCRIICLRSNSIYPDDSTDSKEQVRKARSPDIKINAKYFKSAPSRSQIQFTVQNGLSKIEMQKNTNRTMQHNSKEHKGNNTQTNESVSGPSNQAEITTNQRSMKITRISFLVCFVFIISWIPPWMAFFLHSVPSLATNTGIANFKYLARMTHLVNTIANPFLYAGLNKKFRSQIANVYCKGR